MSVADYQDEISRSNLPYVDTRKEQYNFERWLLDDVQEVNYLQNALLGRSYVEDGTLQEIKGTKLMNQKGARTLTETYILPVVKNAKITYLEKDEVNEIMRGNMRSITKHLFINRLTYEIKIENIDLILTILETFLKTVLNRSLQGREQDRLTTTQKFISEERNYQQQVQEAEHKKKRSILPF